MNTFYKDLKLCLCLILGFLFLAPNVQADNMYIYGRNEIAPPANNGYIRITALEDNDNTDFEFPVSILLYQGDDIVDIGILMDYNDPYVFENLSAGTYCGHVFDETQNCTMEFCIKIDYCVQVVVQGDKYDYVTTECKQERALTGGGTTSSSNAAAAIVYGTVERIEADSRADLQGEKSTPATAVIRQLIQKNTDLLSADFELGLDQQGNITQTEFKPYDSHFETETSEALVNKGLKLSNVYPNPFSQDFTAELYSQTDQMVSLQVQDILGKVIHRQQNQIHAGRNTMSIDIDTELANGLYRLLITNQEGKVQVKPLVKMNADAINAPMNR